MRSQPLVDALLRREFRKARRLARETQRLLGAEAEEAQESLRFSAHSDAFTEFAREERIYQARAES